MNYVQVRWLGRFLSVAFLVNTGILHAQEATIAEKASWLSGFSPEVLAILATGLIAFIVAIVTISASRDIERRKNSMQAIMAARRDTKLFEAMSKMREIDKEDGKSTEVYYHNNCDDPVGRGLLFYLLNHYENIAVGINNRIFDEEIMKRAEYSIIIAVKTMCGPLIDKTRRSENKDTVFKELTDLADRWSKSPLTAKKVGKRRGRLGWIIS